MYNINGRWIRTKTDYLKFPRTKVTTTIRKQYYQDYKTMMDTIGEEYCKGFDMMLELLSEDEELLNKFIEKVKNY